MTRFCCAKDLSWKPSMTNSGYKLFRIISVKYILKTLLYMNYSLLLQKVTLSKQVAGLL